MNSWSLLRVMRGRLFQTQIRFFMQLTGKNAEYADFILSKMSDNGGWISRDDILMYLHDTYDYAAEPEFVLHDLVDNWKFIIVDDEILRLTKEGDKAAKKGVVNYASKEKFMERTVNMKTFLSIISSLLAIIGALISWIIELIS